MVALSMTDHRELARTWNAVLGRLELEVNTHNFNTWLRGTRALRFEGDTLVVEARTAFSCDWLNQRLSVVVQRAAGHVFGGEPRVLFIPLGSAAAPVNDSVAPPAPPVARGATVIGNVNCEYTFERYLAGDGNRLAYESCTSLVDAVEFRISPVVIYGSPGMGKTHLLHALACRAASDGWAVACLSAEEFTTRYMTGLRNHSVEEFQASLRRVRLLIIDDLQYIAGKKATQDELVHTIDAVVNGGGYVVVASELHPLDIDLPDRLTSRLAAGIVTHVEPFRLAERKRFIEQLARERRVALPGWAVERIASCEVPSVRILQGAVNAAIALGQRDLLDPRRLDAELTRISIAASHPGVLEDRVMLDAIARHFEIGFEELAGRSRKLPIGNARAVAAAALKDRGRSLSEIASILGNRDRSTVSQLAERGRAMLATDEALRARLAG